jgi:type I restriction enzyme, S subunit
MIADLKPYAEYKESGSQWLGAVPATWEVRNLRTLISKRTERNRADLPLLSVAREKGVFVRSLTDADENHNVIPEDLSNYKVARAGNLVINKMKAWQGSMGVAPCDGIVSPAYFVFDFRIANHAFGQRLLRSKPYVAHFGQASDGVRVGQWDLSIPGMRQILVLVPPPEEQAAIVRFLDWANGRLERAIRAKRKVIALLGEQKQAIIHRAVIRGLDPSVPLKPSGIPWLGEIPQHWEVRRLKFVASRIVDCLHATPRYSDSGSHPAIRTADVSPGVVHLARAKRIASAEYVRWTARMEPQEGDILYSREGERFGIAACVPAGVKLCISQRMMVFRIGDDNCSAFVMRVLNSQSTYGQALQDVMGATAPHVNISTIRNYFLALPKKQEQEAIVAHVESETKPTDVAISRLEREIELLREYRTRLVADVVTGKLDVREAAARMPDEAHLDSVEDNADLADETEAADEEAG